MLNCNQYRRVPRAQARTRRGDISAQRPHLRRFMVATALLDSVVPQRLEISFAKTCLARRLQSCHGSITIKGPLRSSISGKPGHQKEHHHECEERRTFDVSLDCICTSSRKCSSMRRNGARTMRSWAVEAASGLLNESVDRACYRGLVRRRSSRRSVRQYHPACFPHARLQVIATLIARR